MVRLLLLMALLCAMSSCEQLTAPRPPTPSDSSSLFGTTEDSLLLTPDDEEQGPWYLEAVRRGQLYFRECRRRTGLFRTLEEDWTRSVKRMKRCFEENFLSSLDESINEEEIVFSPFLTLIREVPPENELNEIPRDFHEKEGLISAIYRRFRRLIDTHSIKLNFSSIWGSSDEDIESKTEPRSARHREMRGRRRRQQYRRAFPMMVAGYMMMSAFLVPLGFQFMAMIGGKALLLAKMAFFMSLFSGYKRLTNDIEYHHHPAHHDLLHHYHGFHHRSAEVPTIHSGLNSGLTSGLTQALGLSNLPTEYLQLRKSG